MTFALLVYPLKIGMSQKAHGAWKLSWSAWFRRTFLLCTSTHHSSPSNSCKLPQQTRGIEIIDYSRNPGFTETRLRPLARRRESTLAPLLVFIRVRNPCFFERRRRLGWNVRLGMKDACSYLQNSCMTNKKYK